MDTNPLNKLDAIKDDDPSTKGGPPGLFVYFVVAGLFLVVAAVFATVLLLAY